MNASRKHPHPPQTSAQPGARRFSAFVRVWEKDVTVIVTPFDDGNALLTRPHPIR